MALSLFDLLSLSARSLRGNWIRTTLTMLGVFMGVAAVNATLQVRVISQRVLEQELEKRVAPQVRVHVWGGNGSVMSLDDIPFLRQRLANVMAISGAGEGIFGKVVFQNKTAETYGDAVTEEFLKTSGRKLVQGSFFSALDFETYRPVVVIDEFLRDQLFEEQNPQEQRIYVDGKPFVVIGVVQTRLFRKDSKPEGEMWVPITLSTALTGTRSIYRLEIRPTSLEAIDPLKEQVERLLQQKYTGNDLTFFIRDNVPDIKAQAATLKLASRGLLLVGLIALLISGVGIANITVATVIERTSEIGLRLALGATKQDILHQFMLEAVLLSVVSGAAAIVTIHGATTIVAATFTLPYQFDPATALWSLGAAVLVGVGAVAVPAQRASQLDPVQALRSG
jgi:putative ABC transport system permease protein